MLTITPSQDGRRGYGGRRPSRLTPYIDQSCGGASTVATSTQLLLLELECVLLRKIGCCTDSIGQLLFQRALLLAVQMSFEVRTGRKEGVSAEKSGGNFTFDVDGEGSRYVARSRGRSATA